MQLINDEVLGHRRATSWWMCNLDYPTVKWLLRRQRWQPATRAFTPSLLCPHRHFQLLQIILLIRLLMALLLIPFQRAESCILGEVEQVFSSSGFFSTTLSKTSYNLKKKQFFFLEKCTGYQINGCETGLKGTTPCSQVIYSFILLLTSAHRGGWHFASKYKMFVPALRILQFHLC